mgnify:FL=1
MGISADQISKLIKKSLPDSKVEITDLAGDGNHYSAKIVSERFSGKSRVEQHKMVYKALRGAMDGKDGILHALALQTSSK